MPELIAIRHGRMLASAFAFYRGGAAILACDLTGTPTAGLDAQLCGDAHLANFGVFQAPDRRLVFDVNDFDETLPGPFEWDLKRLAASFAIAGRDNGFGEGKRRDAVLATVRRYREAMREFAGMRDVDVWYSRLDLDSVEKLRSNLSKARAKQFEKGVEKARRKDSLRAEAKLTRRVDGRTRIVSDPPLIVAIEDVAATERGMDTAEEEIAGGLEALLAAYRDTLADDRGHLVAGYRYEHAARKVVGVGSVGTRAWIVLLLGRDEDDPLFLQAKEAQASVLEPYLGASRYPHHGQRVVEGQRMMQAASDIFLGWLTSEAVSGQPHDYYVRQLWDGKGSAEIELMSPSVLAQYGELCGWTLARAHARSGDRIAIAGYLGRGTSFDTAIADFAEAYADQNQSDFEAMRAAADAGRFEVEAGV